MAAEDITQLTDWQGELVTEPPLDWQGELVTEPSLAADLSEAARSNGGSRH